MAVAFVTGGSGFVGGALIRRLVADGWRVRALARSERSARAVAGAGAEPAAGDLDRVDALAGGASGADVVFHCAAFVKQWGRREEYLRGNVTGTRNVIEACRRAGVPRLVHVGTEAAMLAGEPLVGIDEDTPLRPDSASPYCSTKAMAEMAVREANGGDLRTVVVRPRLVWGPGDSTLLPALVTAIHKGRFRWIGGGRQLTSTTYIDNAVHGLVLAATASDPGPSYFVTDGPPVVFRDFITEWVGTQGVKIPDRDLSPAAVRFVAVAAEGVWRTLRLPGEPPITRTAVWLSALECTVDISRAENELGYRPPVTREQGMAALTSPP
ncbi:NAD-dependent epimerase/dehydratase family protein [Micromonospora sp. CPCC 205371]|nr:NAD-dependent epimerase/dehydratase family protein [Micromonospora sp. CPCC 205371]